jgi:ribonuclease HII
MHLAIAGLAVKPRLLIIDGNCFTKYPRIPHRCIIKGDGIYSSIAAASILAKTYRDDHMRKLHQEYPHYGWEENKGYATPRHRSAIREHGICCYHRRSFRQLPEEPELF